MAAPHNSLGPLVRLWGIKTAQLPTGPLIGGAGTDNLAAKDDDDKARSSDGLAQFLGSMLGEAVPFIDSISPKKEDTQGKIKIWKPKGSKSYTPTPATKRKVNVELFERVIKAGELKDLITTGGTTPDTPVRDETWVCRRSVHQDKRGEGTASWEEFRECFKQKHAETEKLFTPSVIRMEKTVVWDCEGAPPQTIGYETWSNFSLCILEARHRVGKPLKDRTFPILQMTCSALDVDNNNNNNMADATDSQAKRESKEKREFLVISFTIPDYFGSTFRKEHVETGTASSGEEDNHIAKETVIASYASIERIRQLDPPSPRVVPSSQPAAASSSSPVPPVQEKQTPQQSSNNNETTEVVKEKGEIEWLMALTSDAGGVLPMFIQNLAVPGQIAKDVPLFLGWIAKERDKNT